MGVIEKVKSILIKLCAILFLAALLFCFTLPLLRASDNSVDEYRDLYRYEASAKDYYRALRSAVNNLSLLAAEMEGVGAYKGITENQQMLIDEDNLHSRVTHLFATLKTIPDPGSRALVASIYDCHEAYLKYRDIIFSCDNHDDDYSERLFDARQELRQMELELFDEIYD